MYHVIYQENNSVSPLAAQLLTLAADSHSVPISSLWIVSTNSMTYAETYDDLRNPSTTYCNRLFVSYRFPRLCIARLVLAQARSKLKRAGLYSCEIRRHKHEQDVYI